MSSSRLAGERHLLPAAALGTVTADTLAWNWDAAAVSPEANFRETLAHRRRPADGTEAPSDMLPSSAAL